MPETLFGGLTAAPGKAWLDGEDGHLIHLLPITWVWTCSVLPSGLFPEHRKDTGP